MTLSWIVCLDIHVSAVLTACSSANVVGVWFRILPLISSSFSLIYGYGCKVGHWYYGAVAYADDVSIVAPSIYSMNKMCRIDPLHDDVKKQNKPGALCIVDPLSDNTVIILPF